MSEPIIDSPATDPLAEAPVSVTSNPQEQPQQVQIDCVVCLETLPFDSIPLGATYEPVARIIPCNHFVHDDCLLKWIERANSCPLCRSLFNDVQVLPNVTGAVLHTYKVENKIQSVSEEPDEQADLEDILNQPADLSWECEVCLLSEDHASLLCCEGCQKSVHTYCIGEPERNPSDLWFCHQCDELRRATRRRPSNRDRQQAAWESAWRHLDADLIDTRRQDDRSQRMNRRRQVAAAQTGDGPNAFEGPIAWMVQTSRPRTTFPHLQAQPMTEEERTSWKLMEVSENLKEGRQKRRRGSSVEDKLVERLGMTLSPPEKDERKFKRPRTKRDSEIAQRAVRHNGESSKMTPITTAVSEDQSSPSGGIFTSILDGIGKSTDVPIVSAADIDPGRDLSMMQPLSPEQSVASPSIRPHSPSPSTNFLPSSPSSPPSSRPHSPSETCRGRPVFSPSSPVVKTPAQSPVRARVERQSSGGPSSPPSSRAQSPVVRPRNLGHFSSREERLTNQVTTVTKEDKETIVGMVSSALKPHYPQKISKDDYTEINKRISRKCYSTLESMRQKTKENGVRDGVAYIQENPEQKKLRELVETEVRLAVNFA